MHKVLPCSIEVHAYDKSYSTRAGHILEQVPKDGAKRWAASVEMALYKALATRHFVRS